MLTVTLYVRQDCPLCQKAEEYLNDLQQQLPHRLVLIDIEKEGIAEFVDKIPVIEVGPYQIKAPFEKKDIQMTLGAANDRIQQLDNIKTGTHQKRIKRGRKISFGISLITLSVIFLITRLKTGSNLLSGMVASLPLLNYNFLYASHSCRGEILLCLGIALLFYLFLHQEP